MKGILDSVQGCLDFRIAAEQSRPLSVHAEKSVLMHGRRTIVLAFPKQGSFASELSIGSFFSVDLFLKDLPSSIDELKGFHAAVSICVPQEVLVAGDDRLENLDAVLGILTLKIDVDNLVRSPETWLGIVGADLERIDDGLCQTPFGRTFRLLPKHSASEELGTF